MTDVHGASPEPSASPEITVTTIGAEAQPVVIIDHATGIAPDLVEFAATRSRFQPATEVGSFYPGLLGTAPTAYVERMVQLILPLIQTHFTGHPVMPARARGNFSLVTTPADALSPEQRLPHVDAADRLQFATVHFLSPTNTDGTGFFRHRATGYETIDDTRLPAYRAALDAELRDAPAGYATGDDAAFSSIGKVEARFDRLILYRAALLHSGLVTHIPERAADPRRGRLTGNLFLQCRAA